MRTGLGRIVALTLAGATLAGAGASVVGAVPGTTTTTEAPTTTATTSTTAPSTTTSTTTTSTSTSTSTTTTTTTSTSTTSTTTTTVVPLVIELPSPPAPVTPSRGSQVQVTETLPPPPTTTTTTLPPQWVLPPGSGTGRRVVYSKPRQRVWTVEANGTVSKTHLVSGRLTWNQPLPGTYEVFSRSRYTCNIKSPHICWRYMVRFAKGPGGDNIGFHEIPTNLRTGYKLQSISQLGTALSAGCVRQAPWDAVYMWNWAGIGTKVVVLG